MNVLSNSDIMCMGNMTYIYIWGILYGDIFY